MTLVVDASVAIKWFFEEEHHREARALLDRSEAIIAPSLVLAEIANAVWKRWRRGEIAERDANRSFELLPNPFSGLYSIEALIGEAGELALQLDHPIYDCFYLALAIRENAPLVTADRKLAQLTERAGARLQLLA